MFVNVSFSLEETARACISPTTSQPTTALFPHGTTHELSEPKINNHIPHMLFLTLPKKSIILSIIKVTVTARVAHMYGRHSLPCSRGGGTERGSLGRLFGSSQLRHWLQYMSSRINSTTNRTDTVKLQTKNYNAGDDLSDSPDILLHLLGVVANYYVSFIANSADWLYHPAIPSLF